MPGFKNVDCEQHPGVDIVCDVAEVHAQLQDECVSEIYASHILEHFTHRRTIEILKGWHRILEKGGILYVGVPDFKRTLELYQKTGLTDWIINYLWGDQGYSTAYHYSGFDEDRLRKQLEDSGFEEISRIEYFPFKTTDCSTNKSTLDSKPVSLNMVAIK